MRLVRVWVGEGQGRSGRGKGWEGAGRTERTERCHQQEEWKSRGQWSEEARETIRRSLRAACWRGLGVRGRGSRREQPACREPRRRWKRSIWVLRRAGMGLGCLTRICAYRASVVSKTSLSHSHLRKNELHSIACGVNHPSHALGVLRWPSGIAGWFTPTGLFFFTLYCKSKLVPTRKFPTRSTQHARHHRMVPLPVL